ncbi:MAG: mechanosensitive ion channel family protein [Deltaproteobacteria bacterium]
MKKWTFQRLVVISLLVLAGAGGLGFLVSELGPLLMGKVTDDILHALNQPYFHIGKVAITPILVTKVVMFILVLTFVSHQARRLMQNEILVRTSMDLGQQFAVARITGYVIFVVGLVVGLETIGVDLSSLVVVGGALGVGVGFGLQNIVSNFVSGLILLVERPIKLGDRVDVGGTNGDVVRISGRSTWVRTNDNVVIIIPNSEFISNRVTNWTANDRQVRFAVPLGVSYSSNPEEVRQVLMDVALSHPDVMREPAPDVRFVDFGDSSLDFELRVWTITKVQSPQILISELYFRIFKAFGERGIEIPFPQRDLHFKSLAFPLPVASRA